MPTNNTALTKPHSICTYIPTVMFSLVPSSVIVTPKICSLSVMVLASLRLVNVGWRKSHLLPSPHSHFACSRTSRVRTPVVSRSSDERTASCFSSVASASRLCRARYECVKPSTSSASCNISVIITPYIVQSRRPSYASHHAHDYKPSHREVSHLPF